MYVIGYDPGLRNFGWATVYFDKHGEPTLTDCNVWCTTPSDTKLRVLAGEDNFRRARELYKNIDSLMRKVEPVAVCIEGMSFPQNPSAAVKLALSWGALAAACTVYHLPTVHPSPQQIKKHVCDKRNASKLEVEEAVKELDPACATVLDRVPKGRREHAVDAYASVLTSLESDVIQLARKMR